MELREAIRRRRMVRNFEDRPVPPEALERILDHARRAPSAGHTQGFAFLVLEGREQVGRFWNCTFPAERRGGFRWPGLFRAPVVILPCASKPTYLDRYAEPDKGWADRDEARWPVPYWDIDCGFATMAMLLTAVDEGLGALFFGIFDSPGDGGCPPRDCRRCVPSSASRKSSTRSGRWPSAGQHPTSRRRRLAGAAARRKRSSTAATGERITS